MRVSLSALAALLFSTVTAAPSSVRGPFLQELGNSTWIIGNEVWNMTQGPQYGTKLFYKNHDCVGDAVGHYVSTNGAANDFKWTSASIVNRGTSHGDKYIDISFTAVEGEMHWVIFEGQAGAYQYFVNRALPVLGEFRTLWRLDNTTFTYGKTDVRDEELPPLSDYLPQNKIQDETWLKPDGSGYITKYDLTSWIRTQTYYGVYGPGFGSWYINPGKDYYNGNHLKQELMIHRESASGDVVQLNMLHGTHFMVSSADAFADGKLWGPWLWYLNDGSKEDAEETAKEEFDAWPYYDWLKEKAYKSRGTVKGNLKLSDGRPATNAAIFLGDNHPNKTALDMGSGYYYTSYADSNGNFEFEDVRSGTYGFQAWSNGSKIADVTTSFLQNDVVVLEDKITHLDKLVWPISPKTKLFQVGDFDRTDYGFAYGGSPHAHGVAQNCPASLTYTVGTSQPSDWCFAQSKLGNWTIAFDIAEIPAQKTNATLIVSLAGYSTGVSSTILANGAKIGNLTSGTPNLLNDPSLYRSGTTAGEWRYFEFNFNATLLKAGSNQVTFQATRNTTWHGFMWDSIVLEW